MPLAPADRNACDVTADSVSRDRHTLDEDRAALPRAPAQDIGSGARNAEKHVFQIAGDRDLLDGIGDLAVLDPVTGRAARVITGHRVYALSHQLGYEQPAIELLQKRTKILARVFQDEIV